MVGALCYKPEGRRFNSRCYRIFNWPIPSSSTVALGVKGGPHLRLRTSPPSVSWLVENVGASMSHNPVIIHGLLQGYPHMPFLISSISPPYHHNFLIAPSPLRKNCEISITHNVLFVTGEQQPWYMVCYFELICHWCLQFLIQLVVRCSCFLPSRK
jgi:hypothetical protein